MSSYILRRRPQLPISRSGAAQVSAFAPCAAPLSLRRNEALQDVEPLVQFFVADREGDEDAEDVAVDPAREEEQPLLACLARDAVRLVAGALGQLDRDHRPDPAD